MSNLELEISDRVAKITLLRPESLNAIDRALSQEFEAAINQVRQASNTVVLLTQGYGRAFCAGSDLKELANCSPQQAADLEFEHSFVFSQLETLPQITVALWRGYVLGGGLFMGIYHDFRVASQQAYVGLPEVAHGWIPPWGVSRLVELIGWQSAKKLILLGEHIDGVMAEKIGLVDMVWSEAEFEEKVEIWVEHLASRPITALRETKDILRHMRSVEHDIWDRQSADAFRRCYATQEAQQAVERFIKRKGK